MVSDRLIKIVTMKIPKVDDVIKVIINWDSNPLNSTTAKQIMHVADHTNRVITLTTMDEFKELLMNRMVVGITTNNKGQIVLYLKELHDEFKHNVIEMIDRETGEKTDNVNQTLKKQAPPNVKIVTDREEYRKMIVENRRRESQRKSQFDRYADKIMSIKEDSEEMSEEEVERIRSLKEKIDIIKSVERQI